MSTGQIARESCQWNLLKRGVDVFPTFLYTTLELSLAAHLPMTTTTEPSSLPISSRVDLLQSLPYDVVITILSFLTQQDCLRCLEVCREWCTLIPMYARETVFREIRLDEQHLDDNKSMHKFLGPHVDAVSFKKCHRLDRVLDMLQAKQCSNIQRLGKYICDTSKCVVKREVASKQWFCSPTT